MNQPRSFTPEELRIRGIMDAYFSATFDDYIASKKIKKQLENYCANWKRVTSDGIGLLLVGGVNSGKTMLANIIAKTFLGLGLNVRVTHLEDIKTIFAQGWSSPEALNAFHEIYQECDLLVIDDLGKEFTNDLAATAFDNLLRHRDRRLLPTIMTSNYKTDKLSAMYGKTLVGLLNRRVVVVECPSDDKYVQQMINKNSSILEESK